jgi:capsular polysaccharide biosynthesis protein
MIDSAALLALIMDRATEAPLPDGWHIVIGQYDEPNMRRIVTETLTCLAPGVPVLEHPDDEVWAFDTLLYPSPVHVPPLYKHPGALARLRAQILREAPAAAGRRLFITRGAQGPRHLENETDLLHLAVAHGYERVEPQRLSLHEQASLFQSAAAVVGVKGAALSNLVFCQPGAQCLVLSPGDFLDPFFWDLASAAGVTYTEVFGRLTGRDRPRSQNSFVIDRQTFLEHLPLARG